MDDGKLWAQEKAGEPVSHCRSKIAHDQAQMTERRNLAAFRIHERRTIRRAA